MTKGLYSKLAFEGIKKNGKLYIPYIISIISMVSILYILCYLAQAPSLDGMVSGQNLRSIMGLGIWVMTIFSVIFLIYTNSFLTKRRNSEFALYNVLGMNKKNVLKILAREYVFLGLFSIISGLLVGILFSKLFELILMKMCGYEATFVIYFSTSGIVFTAVFFAAILFVLFILASIRILKNKPIDLLKSKNYGEKEPKGNWFMGISGAVILVAAYIIAIKCRTVSSVFSGFFGAVIMVIIATYLLFISGSVFLCRMLKKNKNYYYSKEHFISLSGMAYRMKRNGAGLASICILSTMVLVMMASAGSLYFGKTKSMNSLYPYEFQVGTYSDMENDVPVSKELKEEVYTKIENALSDVEGADIRGYEMITATGGLSADKFSLFSNYYMSSVEADITMVVTIIPLEDYNKMGSPIELSEDEVILAPLGWEYKYDTIDLFGKEKRVVGSPDERYIDSNNTVFDSMLIVVPNFEECLDYVATSQEASYTHRYQLAVDTGLSYKEQKLLMDKMQDAVLGIAFVDGRCAAYDDFSEMYASLFLLGIFLSIAFMGACVLIMYFKQITEGYEDASNYRIMRNVGMTKKEIKKSVNSQTLITFFSPLVAAGIHLAFSGPLIHTLLLYFGVGDLTTFILTYLGCFAAFSLFYLLVYRKTVKAYVEIVAY